MAHLFSQGSVGHPSMDIQNKHTDPCKKKHDQIRPETKQSESLLHVSHGTRLRRADVVTKKEDDTEHARKKHDDRIPPEPATPNLYFNSHRDLPFSDRTIPRLRYPSLRKIGTRMMTPQRSSFPSHHDEKNRR